MDEGVSEGLAPMQIASHSGGHAEDDERYGDVFWLAEASVLSSEA